MPKPLYTIGALFCIDNKENGAVSLIEVLEKVQITHILPPTLQTGQILSVPFQPFRIVACWMLEQGEDPNGDYEFEMSLILPPNNEMPLGSGKAVFASNKPLFRVTVNMMSPPPITAPGIMRAVSRIRLRNAPDWISQEYPVILEMVQAEVPGSTTTPPAPSQN